MSDEGAEGDEVDYASPQSQYELALARSSQSLPIAAAAASLAAIAGAIVWAGITTATEYQIGWMAIGVGALVGFAVRKAGAGYDAAFGVIGALFSALGCALGNVLAGCAFLASFHDVALGQVLQTLDLQLGRDLLVGMFTPMDLFFYGIAIYEGYRLSINSPPGDTNG